MDKTHKNVLFINQFTEKLFKESNFVLTQSNTNIKTSALYNLYIVILSTRVETLKK